MGKLKDRMRADLERYGLRVSTREQYLRQVELCAEHFHRSPDRLDTADIENYLDYLATAKNKTEMQRQQTLVALRFFYFVTVDRPEVVARLLTPVDQPAIPRPLPGTDLRRILFNVSSPLHRTVLTVALGGGLGLSETCRLETEHIDSKRMLIRIESATGSWPRFVPLHPEMLNTLRQWWRDTFPASSLLFPVENEYTPLTYGSLTKALRAALKESGFQQPIKDSLLRYSFFLDHLSRGVHPTEVIHLLRFTSIRHVPTRSTAPPASAPCQASIGEKGARI
jgi:integrase/recombinase XerD